MNRPSGTGERLGSGSQLQPSRQASPGPPSRPMSQAAGETGSALADITRYQDVGAGAPQGVQVQQMADAGQNMSAHLPYTAPEVAIVCTKGTVCPTCLSSGIAVYTSPPVGAQPVQLAQSKTSTQLQGPTDVGNVGSQVPVDDRSGNSIGTRNQPTSSAEVPTTSPSSPKSA